MIHINLYKTDFSGAAAVQHDFNVAATSRETTYAAAPQAFSELNNNNSFDDLRWDEYGNPYVVDSGIH